jgi:hypothetical protein
MIKGWIPDGKSDFAWPNPVKEREPRMDADERLLFECGISLQDLPGRWGGKFSGFNIDAGLWIWWIVGVLLSRKHAVAV